MPHRSRLSGGIFYQLTVDEFGALLASVAPRRRIDAIHLHHTWIPRREQFRGASSIAAMWKHHTTNERWSDIAQHLTIDPDGGIWTGRHWDLPPASARGHNGSVQSGPFMIEMVGNFDRGADAFTDPQRAAVLTVLALLLDAFQLPTSAIRFHNELSAKTCPGGTIERMALLQAVEPLRGTGGRAESAPPSPFSRDDDALFQARAFLGAPPPPGDGARSVDLPIEETYDAEPSESDDVSERTARAVEALESAAREVRDVDVALTPVIREALRPHVVNLTRGRFSTSGEFTTSKEDVDAIFDEHLPRAMAAQAGRPFRIVAYAHGGLVGERDGLGVALKHVDWWKANGVYPIYFAWETDFLTSVINAITGAMGGRAVARDALDLIDAQIEAAARRFKANSIWADMKHVARLSSEPDGGAAYVATRLAQFCGAHGQDVEIHAIGHSAGSNFNSFFVPVALDAGVPSFRTLQLLAPAIGVDAFFATLGRRLGQIGTLTVFTMKDSFEQADQAGPVYNKSLLYLLYHALEEARETDLLGLEISIRRDMRLRRLFGLDGTPHPKGHEVVWSITTGDRRSSAESTTHGGFDDDPATMNSVLRRVLGRSGAEEVTREFVRPSRSADVAAWSAAGFARGDSTISPVLGPAKAAHLGSAASAGHDGSAAQPATRPASGGRRRALCVGINAYKRQPLRGCVADAERWARTLGDLGFEVAPVLRDAEATGDRIVGALTDLLEQSRAGDVLVFQFAGHGTTLPDITSDEAGSDSPAVDEAVCAYDFTEGRFVVDDELAAVFAAAPAGVQITSFIDCCHSGTITRLGIGPADGRHEPDERPRFLHAEPAEIDAFLARRRSFAGGGGPSARARGPQRDVLFSACRSTEVAYESRGQGDFTRHATSVLQRGSGVTNGALLERVQKAFGVSARQHPELHPPDAAGLPLFGALDTRLPETAALAGAGSLEGRDLAALLRTLADVIGR
jgi:hypothetical protein